MQTLILDFIKVSNSLKSRGVEIYKASAFYNKVLDEKMKVFQVVVQGTKKYEVSLDWRLSLMNGTCTCPYDWTPVCKHQVAAALLLKDLLSGEEPRLESEATNKLKNTADPYFLGEYSKKNGFENLGGFNPSKYKEDGRLSIIEASDSLMKVRLYTHEYYDYSFEEITLISENNKRSMYCSCKSFVVDFCVHEKIFLKEILSYDYSDKILDENYSKALKNKVLLKGGLEDNEENRKLLIAMWDINSRDIAITPSKKLKD